MPLEKKRPRICPGYHPIADRADALGDNAIGSPLDSAAAGGTTPELLPICRRANAAAAHITGAEAGESPTAEPEGDVGTDPSPMAGMLSREALGAWVGNTPGGVSGWRPGIGDNCVCLMISVMRGCLR